MPSKEVCAIFNEKMRVKGLPIPTLLNAKVLDGPHPPLIEIHVRLILPGPDGGVQFADMRHTVAEARDDRVTLEEACHAARRLLQATLVQLADASLCFDGAALYQAPPGDPPPR